ncbi:MAG: PTS sugar transporter subunit IIA [Planctomycetes bacterium]|nr:PTS sugar transporter subunit IIA [Planctomycetota bacterium]
MIRDIVESSVLITALGAATQAAAVDEILAAALGEGRLAKGKLPAIKKKLAEREALGSTGIGNGVAVPHVKTDAVASPVLVLGRSAEGIDWSAIDGRRVHVVFLILVPTTATQEHLALLRWISSLARDADFRRFAKAADEEKVLRELLLEHVKD